MARKLLPDHAGRMPDHPRYGNPSDPAEEAERIGMAFENVDKWQRKYEAELSGGVSMSVGNGPIYHVPIGQPEIAQKIVSRPIAPPVVKALPEPAEAAPEPPPIVISTVGRFVLTAPPPPQLWIWRLINRIKGAFR